MIIKQNYETQDCGSLMVDGIRVEYFIQDLKRLYELIKTEIDCNDPSHLSKFVTCKIIYDKDNEVAEFIDYAKTLYNTKIKESFNDDDKFALFAINNRIEDLESLINDDSFYAVYFVVLEKIRSLYHKIYGIIDLPLTKIYRLYNDSNFAKNYISSPVHNLPNQEFIKRYSECLKITDKNVMLKRIKELQAYSFNNLAFDPTNFCLKYTKKAPFRV